MLVEMIESLSQFGSTIVLNSQKEEDIFNQLVQRGVIASGIAQKRDKFGKIVEYGNQQNAMDVHNILEQEIYGRPQA